MEFTALYVHCTGPRWPRLPFQAAGLGVPGVLCPGGREGGARSGAGLTGCLFSFQRPALPPMVHGKDLEVVGDPRGQPHDLGKGVSAHGQPLSVLSGQVDGDHVHAVAGHCTVRGCPHDGDLHIRHFHELQIPGRGDFI